MFGDDEQVPKEQWWCGRAIPGAAVGQPGPARCRGQEFHVRLEGSQVLTRCMACQSVERARTRCTAQRRIGGDALACERCGSPLFALYEEGNEVQTKCVNCGLFMPLGVAQSPQS